MGFLLSETHKRLINAIILAVYITQGTRDSPYNTHIHIISYYEARSLFQDTVIMNLVIYPPK